MNGPHGYFGVGCYTKGGNNCTESPNNYWRIVCPPRRQMSVVIMGLHTAPETYLQVKTTKFEGCTNRYHGRHFHKRSVVAAFVGNSSILSAFKVAYACFGELDARNLCTCYTEISCTLMWTHALKFLV